jgi:hypothetical protein
MSDAPDITTPAQPSPAVLPPENKTRGTLLALLAAPAGIIVWNVVWAIGFISGWVSLGVALFALWLYRKGSGGRIGYDAAVRLSALTVVTLAVAFFIGLAVDRAVYGPFVQYTDLGLNIVVLVVFAILGVVIVFRTAATTLKQQKAADAAAGTAG